jgi:hypothetical protein
LRILVLFFYFSLASPCELKYLSYCSLKFELDFSFFRDNDLHRLLFMPNGLPDGAELAYYVKGQVSWYSLLIFCVYGLIYTSFLFFLNIWLDWCAFQKLLGGYKQGNGIVCGCCDVEVWPYYTYWHQLPYFYTSANAKISFMTFVHG